jgi:hypothetical protein
MKNTNGVALRARRKRQGGHEILEFALTAILLIPLFMGSFVVGINLIRSIQANHVTRDLADMYIHGADFSDVGIQTVAQRLATGMNLQLGGGTSSSGDNLGNTGRGIVWISKIMWVGGTSDPNCQGVLPATCTNANKFVFVERIRFGNGSLETERASGLGHPSLAVRNDHGLVTDDLALDQDVRVPEPYQTQLQNRWQVTDINLGRAPLVDGQVAFVAEAYFQSPDLYLGSVSGRGVYSRWFY